MADRSERDRPADRPRLRLGGKILDSVVVFYGSDAVGTVISRFPKFVCVIQNVGVFTKGLLQALSRFWLYMASGEFSRSSVLPFSCPSGRRVFSVAQSGGLLAQGLHPTAARVALWSSLECSLGRPHLLFSEEVHGHTPSRRSGG